MPWHLGGLISIVGLLFLIGMGVPISFSFALTGIIGIFLLEGANVLFIVPQIIHDTGIEFVLVTIPLFIFMAEILFAAGFTQDLYRAFDTWMGRLPGGLAMATVGSCGAFAAVCGSSYVTAATVGRMALPELVKRQYSKRLASGAVAAGGTLGILIPPSLVFILYGFMSDTSIGKLFFAGVIPGIIMVFLYCLVIMAQTRIFGHSTVQVESSSFKEKLHAIVSVGPIAVISVVVLGSIYFGIATASEAAAVGCSIALIGAFIYGKLSWQVTVDALKSTVLTTGFIAFILVGAKILAFLLAMLGVSDGLSVLASGVGEPYLVLAATLAVLVVLGMFMEGMAILVLAVPVFVPMLAELGFDPIWFGVIFTIFVELCLITPPIGMNCYIVADMSEQYGISINDVFVGIIPFALMMLATVAIVVLVPSTALWLPGTMIMWR